MRIYLLILLILIYSSCVTDTKRSAIECFVYDSLTKKPIENVQIIQKLDGKRVIVSRTLKSGYFKLEKITKLSFGIEKHDLSNLYFLEKKGYKVDSLVSYGGINDVDIRDSVFMKKKK